MKRTGKAAFALDWNTTIEKHINGPVVILQTKSDPGDMGEPRTFIEDGVTYICVPNFELWPRPADAGSVLGGLLADRRQELDALMALIDSGSEQITRLRAALKKVVESADYERDMFGVRLPDGLLIDIDQARAVLAGSPAALAAEGGPA